MCTTLPHIAAINPVKQRELRFLPLPLSQRSSGIVQLKGLLQQKSCMAEFAHHPNQHLLRVEKFLCQIFAVKNFLSQIIFVGCGNHENYTHKMFIGWSVVVCLPESEVSDLFEICAADSFDCSKILLTLTKSEGQQQVIFTSFSISQERNFLI